MKDPFNYHRILEHLILGSLPYQPEHIDQLQQEGIQSILSLTRTNPLCFDGIGQQIEKYGIYHFHCPISDGGTPTTTQLALIRGFYQFTPGALYIHCRGGVGRSGIVAIACLYFNGMDKNMARNIVALRYNHANIKAGPISQEQRDWIDSL